MRYLLTMLSISVLFTLKAQDANYFSKKFDAGGTNLVNEISIMTEENDIVYHVAFNVCNLTDTSYTECSVVGKMNKVGRVIKEVPYEWLDPNQARKPLFIDNDHLLVVDGIYKDTGFVLRLLIMDKYSLDSLAAFDYTLNNANSDKTVKFYEGTSVIAFDKYYIIAGWGVTKATNHTFDYCILLDRYGKYYPSRYF